MWTHSLRARPPGRRRGRVAPRRGAVGHGGAGGRAGQGGEERRVAFRSGSVVLE